MAGSPAVRRKNGTTNAQVVRALIGCYYDGPVSQGQVRRLPGSSREQVAVILQPPTLDQLLLLGAAPGRLHSLPAAGPGPVPGRDSGVPGMDARLARLRNRLAVRLWSAAAARPRRHLQVPADGSWSRDRRSSARRRGPRSRDA